MGKLKRMIYSCLENHGINTDILKNYDEPHRFYHNFDHIFYMVELALTWGILTNDLLLAIIFHDIIYNPKDKDNEEKSAELAFQLTGNETIKNAILDTKNHEHFSSQLASYLCDLDLANIYGDFQTFYDNSYKIFKEYQFVDFSIYKDKRIEVLQKYGVNETYIEAIKAFKPKIGLYAGSFNPFHKGHYNILQKAEQIFDKVIIARGVNPAKANVNGKLVQTLNDGYYTLPDVVTKYRQIISFDGLLVKLIDSLDYDVTVIRGLRNSTDLQYEMTQYQYSKDIKSDIKMVSIFCDREFEHISSSSVKLLEKYGESNKYLL
jgi:pantetheine-phosphate adenylyltransferase